MIKEKFHLVNTGKAFSEFEKTEFSSLSENKILGWNTWRIIKTPLFFYCIYNNTNTEIPNTKISGKFFSGLINLFSGISAIAKLFYVSVKKRKGKNLALIITLSANKTYALPDGRLTDVVVDNFITSKAVKEFIYLETPFDKKKHTMPSVVKADFLTTQFSPVLFFLSKLMHLANNFSRQSKEVSLLWNNFFENYEVKFSSGQIQNFLIGFAAEYYTYLCIYGISKPNIVILNDQMASGKMAAAKKLGIKVIELQHGLMDEFYPQYQLHEKFSAIKKSLPIADTIAVFGAFHKNQLLAKNFYSDQDITILGKFAMNEKLNAAQKNTNSKNILFITQGELLFTLAQKHLKDILGHPDFEAYNLTIKVHPLETDRYLLFYNNLAAGFSGKVSVIQNEQSISQLLPAANFVVGYNSTVLLEAVYFNKKVYSIAYEECPDGIYSVIGEDPILKPFISVVEDINGLFLQINKNESLKANSINSYLFDKNYSDNCYKIINEAVNS